LPPPDQNGDFVTSGSNSSVTLSPDLVDGVYEWRAMAVDPEGLISAYTSNRRVKIDTVPPVAVCKHRPAITSVNYLSILNLAGNDPVPPSGGSPSGIKSARLERSTDGGSTWNQVASYLGSFSGLVTEHHGLMALITKRVHSNLTYTV